ncbi:polyketide cyclase/dehydrase/lipid transport protein [Hoeflea marina]|uniref:Polyketide cyclase/dehydrase/lipid transport protein n=1 Tax=Hoeflea marina TaxID=274592 RepID=A0A317PKW9_9HYPH|nr:SRPBCC family protein [Hoeflea marina]PWW01436.1 polyketide cyclase/dehydrase/lipid transport protein [Hoeflea marina]
MANVTISSVIDAPVEQVWARIRDFNGLPSWHPRMVESHIEDGKPATEIGCVRNFTLASGPKIREKLTAFSDEDFLVSYSIIEHPAPISNHTATLQLRRITDGDRTYAEWSSSFDAPAEKADEMAAGMGANVFQGGFNALHDHFTAKA